MNDTSRLTALRSNIGAAAQDPDVAESISCVQKLPEELWVQIFVILGSLGSLKDISSLSLTCKTFEIISSDNIIWKSLCQTHFPSSNASYPPQASCNYQNLYKDHYIFRHYLLNPRPIRDFSDSF